MNESYTEEIKPNKIAKGFFDIFEPIVFALIAVVIISLFVGRLTVVNGVSMETTLHDREYIVISDLFLSYEPKEGDIVVVHGNFEGTYYDKPLVKRVIATEGQTVRIQFFEGSGKPACVYVDGELIENESAIYVGDLETYEYQYLGYYIDGTPLEHASPYYDYENKVYERTVDEGCLFLMGDNRYHSGDSRTNDVGCVPKKYVLGKAIFRLTPLSKMGILN